MYPVCSPPTFKQLVQERTAQIAREDLGLDLIGANGIEIYRNNDTQTTISKYIDLIGSLTIYPTTAEVGQVITNTTLNWSYNKGTISSQSINNGIGALSVSLRTYIHSPIFISNTTTYTLTTSDGTNTITPSATLSYYHRRFWGVSINSFLTESEIESGSTELSNSKSKSITFNCTGGRRFWYAYPTYLGLASASVNGFPFSGWIGGTTPQTISITNSYGYTENYYYYMVSNIQNGSAISTIFN